MASTARPYGLSEAAHELTGLARVCGDQWWQVGDAAQWTPRWHETDEPLRGADRLVASIAAITARVTGGRWREGNGGVEVALSDGTIVVPHETPRPEPPSDTGGRLARVADDLLLGAGARVLVGGARRPAYASDRRALLVPADDAWRGTATGVALLVDAIVRMRLSEGSEASAGTMPLVASIACAFALAGVGIAPGGTGGAVTRPPLSSAPAWLGHAADASALARLADEAERVSGELTGMVSPRTCCRRPDPGTPTGDLPHADARDARGRRHRVPSGPYTLRQAMRAASAASDALADPVAPPAT